MSSVLNINDLWVGYGNTDVVKGISITINSGSIVGLLGRNGAGKSTVLRSVFGILNPKKGVINFLGKDISGKEPRFLINTGLSYVSQGGECFPDLTVAENINTALICFNLPKPQRNQYIRKVLDLFPRIADAIDEPAHRLSGGLQQMLVIAMALCHNPKCLLLDEPSLGLGASVLDQVKTVLKNYTANGGCVLIVEQKPQVIFDIGDNAYYLEDGKIALEGKPETLREDPVFIESYLGLNNH